MLSLTGKALGVVRGQRILSLWKVGMQTRLSLSLMLAAKIKNNILEHPSQLKAVLNLLRVKMRSQLIKIIRQYRRHFCDYCGAKLNERDRVIEQLADHLIENGLTFLDWIPVEEKPPHEHESVLVWDAKDRFTAEAFFMKEGESCYWVTDRVRWDYNDMTHWAVMPRGPKGRKVKK